MPAPTWAAAPVEVAAAMAEVVEAVLDSGVEVEEAGMVVMLELGVGVTELTRTRVLVMVVVEVIVVRVSVAAASGASARQREVMRVVNFIAIEIESKVKIDENEMSEQNDQFARAKSADGCTARTTTRQVCLRYVSTFEK
jgi:hypothetical protein